METFEAVEALTTYQLAAEAAADTLKKGVWTARETGASWTEIGATLNISKQAAQQRFGNRPAAATVPEEEPSPAEEEPYEFQASMSPVVAKALVKAVLNGLDVKKEELAPMYTGALEQITVTIQEPKGNGWIYLVQTIGTLGRSSHTAYLAYTTGGKPVKISIRDFMSHIRAWGDPAAL